MKIVFTSSRTKNGRCYITVVNPLQCSNGIKVAVFEDNVDNVTFRVLDTSTKESVLVNAVKTRDNSIGLLLLKDGSSVGSSNWTATCSRIDELKPYETTLTLDNLDGNNVEITEV